MTNGTTGRRFSSFQAMGEAITPATPTESDRAAAARKGWETRRANAAGQQPAPGDDAQDRAQEIADHIAEETAAPAFQEAFGDVGALSIIELGGEREELDMPEPIEAQHDCAAIMATLFDLFRDTRLETSAQAIAWGFVNSFHYEAQKLAREEDSLARDLGEMTRRPDPSEIYASELEELQLRPSREHSHGHRSSFGRS